MKLRVLSARDLRRALPMRDAVEAMKRAFADLSSGRATVPQRMVLPLAPEEPAGGETAASAFLLKPAIQPGGALGAKLLTLMPGNRRRGLPLIHALVVLFDPRTGAPAALCEGGFLTAWRTGAASGAATDLLARPEARRAAILGAGVQARTQLLAVAAVRPLERVRVFCRTPAARQAFAADLAEEIRVEVMPAASAAEAIRDADVICTATTSSEPVIPGAEVAAGAHVNAVGSFTPEMRELDAELIGRARIFVDARGAAASEAGELIAAERAGLTRRGDWTELGEVVEGTRPGRRSADEITLFKSVGVAVQDTAAAALALERATALGLGAEVSL